MIYGNLGKKDGILTVGGIKATFLAKEYKTPLYILDRDVIRKNIREYMSALNDYAPKGSLPFFASKSCSFKDIYRTVNEEGMGTDLVSPGEIYTASSVGFDMTKTVFHGNCKTDDDIDYAMSLNVGFFAVDTFEELEAIEKIASEKGRSQKIIIRLSPGIDAHTHRAVVTGNVDSKFGFPIFSGDAAKAIGIAKSSSHLVLSGLHCHIGSQITDISDFEKAAEVMMKFISENLPECEYLNLGGGFGIRYKECDSLLPIREGIKTLCETINKYCEKYGIKSPKIMLEPGRSIVGDAGTTLYTVGSVKEIPGIKNYVAIDGGMADNPRFALYHSDYTVVLANKIDEKCDYSCTVAGRCCESGDIIQENVNIPKPQRNDIIAVLGTGAYNFSMSSNYNRLCKPAMVMIENGKAEIVIKRETFEHLTALEV